MPILPPFGSGAPYDPTDTVLNFARIIANDCALSLAGNLLADTQPYVYPMLNLAWRKLQDRLGNNAVEEFPQEIIISPITPVDSSVANDPGSQVVLNFQSYFDGFNYNASIYLPVDLLVPYKMWERMTGVNQAFIPMIPCSSGLPSVAKTTLNRLWEWRGDAIYMPGAMQTNDLKLRYKRFLPDIAQTDGTNPIPIIRCAVALAYLVIDIFATGRGSTMLQKFQTEKEDAIKQVINTTSRKKQRENFRRRPYSQRGRRWAW